MTYIGLFEGISGFGLAFKRTGATIRAICEINAECQKVLRRHHPEAELISDVKTINKDTFSGEPITVLAGGFPCQDLSVAGLRKGLDGERSGLWFEFIRIISDHRPRWVVIENVPGLLSSNNGRDFAVILRGLVECGYGVCWRVLDSQYDGVAQRRNRVFIVASFGTERCAEVLFEREGGAWDSPPSRETGEGVAGTLSARTSAGGGLGTDFECSGGLQPSFKRRGGFGWSQADDVTGTLESEGGTHQGGPEKIPLVIQPQITHALTSAGADASEDGTGRGTPLVVASRDVAQSLTANYGKQPDNSDTALGPNLAIAFAQNTRDEVRYINGDGQIAGALAAEAGMKQQSYVMAMQINASDEVRTSDIAYTLNTNGNATGRNSPTIAGQFGVRRLTPTECERLQGFPDGHTAIGADGKPISDSARYRMLGNAVCVPTVEWIARRIAQQEAA